MESGWDVVEGREDRRLPPQELLEQFVLHVFMSEHFDDGSEVLGGIPLELEQDVAHICPEVPVDTL
jgi:hypothetical protein